MESNWKSILERPRKPLKNRELNYIHLNKIQVKEEIIKEFKKHRMNEKVTYKNVLKKYLKDFYSTTIFLMPTLEKKKGFRSLI
jgi:hypothetical protein